MKNTLKLEKTENLTDKCHEGLAGDVPMVHSQQVNGVHLVAVLEMM